MWQIGHLFLKYEKFHLRFFVDFAGGFKKTSMTYCVIYTGLGGFEGKKLVKIFFVYCFVYNPQKSILKLLYQSLNDAEVDFLPNVKFVKYVHRDNFQIKLKFKSV